MPAVSVLSRVGPRSIGVNLFAMADSIAANFAAIGALFAVLRRYTVGASSTSWNLDADKLWWWNTPVTPLTLLGLAFVVQTIFFGSAYKILTRIEETNVPLPLSGPSR